MNRSILRGALAPLFVVLVLALATFYPSNLSEDYSISRNGHAMPVVQGTENFARHINIALPLAMAIVLRDWNGLGQIFLVAATTRGATLGQKHLFNDVMVGNTRLGQRPISPNRNHNMPSGHSSAAAAGAWFTMRRYSMWFGLIVIPVLFLTMYARYMMDAHTISATIAGAATGILATSIIVRHAPGLRRRIGVWLSNALRRFQFSETQPANRGT
ncbi:phosphatase PAP2 family protein [Shimia haliotis]|uniref:Lipid A 1-phosphatase n=1 Tax=Shimia haliotis TaxID=1280847 RepID=A0A1I4C5M1_9RHOB|nr:phosphatase PAP2 family protein [Shimia haliotis]SFK75687.1 lipid A 1-phosphatase [Shimia haliotis]